MHTSTFQGNPLACAMAVATIDTIADEALLDHATAIGAYMNERLQPLVGNHGIAALRVAGAQAALVFCDGTGQPDPARSVLLQRRMLAQNVLVYGGGRQGECLMVVPPLNLPLSVLANALEHLVAQIEQTS